MASNPTSQKLRGTRRILIFSLVYYPRFIGGAEIAIKEITDRIPESEIEFHMVTLRLDSSLPKYEKVGHVHVYRVGFSGSSRDSADSLRFPLYLNKYLLPFIGYFKARSLHQQFSYEAVWSMMATYNGFVALFFKKSFPNVRYILTLQEGDPIDYIKRRVRLVYFLFKRIFTSADIVQTISNYLADFARAMGYRGRIEVVPNGVDNAHFNRSYPAEELDTLRAEVGKTVGDILIITTSRLVVKNAVSDVIKSLPHMPSSYKFLILGRGYEEERLRKLAKILGVGDRVIFRGYVSHEEMPKFLKISDIFIRPSLSEGFGNSFIEAMAAGLPVIATPVGGIPDFLSDPDKSPQNPPTGLFVPPKDPKAIAKAVERLMKDKRLRETLINNARRLVREHYDWDLIAEAMKRQVFVASFHA